MQHPLNSIKLLFWGTFFGLALWMLSPGVQAGINTKPTDHLPLAEYEAEYYVSWHGIRGGESKHRLVRRADGAYHVSSTTEPYLKFLPFKYVEKADFQWENGKVIPRNYYYNLKEGRRHKKGNVAFDWRHGKVFNKISKEPWEENTIKDMQDKLSHTVQLRLDLLNDHQPSYTYTVAEDDEVKPYTFKLLNLETLETNIGTLQALKIEHTSKKGRKTHMWLSVDHDYLPVQVHHFRDGKKVGSGAIKSYTPTQKHRA